MLKLVGTKRKILYSLLAVEITSDWLFHQLYHVPSQVLFDSLFVLSNRSILFSPWLLGVVSLHWLRWKQRNIMLSQCCWSWWSTSQRALLHFQPKFGNYTSPYILRTIYYPTSETILYLCLVLVSNKGIGCLLMPWRSLCPYPGTCTSLSSCQQQAAEIYNHD